MCLIGLLKSHFNKLPIQHGRLRERHALPLDDVLQQLHLSESESRRIDHVSAYHAPIYEPFEVLGEVI